MPRTDKKPFRADIRGKLVEVASQGTTISYLALGVGRAMIGRYLYRIAHEEAAAGRPPLTAVVVRKNTRLPGDGFREAMVQVRFIEKSDSRSEREVWEAALREVHDYWRPKLSDELR